MDLIQAQPGGHILAHRPGVSGEHDSLADTHGLEGGDGLDGVFLHLVGDDDVSQIPALRRHVDRGADPVAGVPFHAHALHELVIAHGHRDPVHLGPHAMARDLLHVRDPARVDFLAVGLPQGSGDGVVGIALR